MASRKYVKARRKSTYVSRGTGSKIVSTKNGTTVVERKSKRYTHAISGREVKRISKSTTYRRGGKEWTQKNLYKETLKQVRETNARLASLERRYKTGTWASKKLMNRLDTLSLKAWTKGGKVKISPSMSKTKLAAIHKATSQFLASKTSTKTGIKSVRSKTIESLKESLSLDGKKVSDEDAEAMYDMLGNKDFDDVASQVDASALWSFIDYAKEKNLSENEFVSLLVKYGMSNDLDMREKAQRLYQRYVL